MEMSMDVPQQQPDLIPSNTTDDYDDGEDSSRDEWGGVSEEERRRYVLRYEKMLVQQEAEERATMEYIRPILERLVELGSTHRKKMVGPSLYEDQWSVREFQYLELKRALQNLESTQECMKMDQQLILVLRSLTDKIDTSSHEENITWMEFVQCYRLCVLGMLTLKHLPKTTFSRSRTRDRTLEIISLFQPAMESSSSCLRSETQECMRRSKHPAVDETSRAIVTRELVIQEMAEPATSKTSTWRLVVGTVLFCAFACMMLTFGPTYVKVQEIGMEERFQHHPQQQQSRRSNARALFQESIKRNARLVIEEEKLSLRRDVESSLQSKSPLDEPITLEELPGKVPQHVPILSAPMGLAVSAAAVLGGAVGILGFNWIVPMVSNIGFVPIGVIAITSVAITSVAKGSIRWITKLLASMRHQEAH